MLLAIDVLTAEIAARLAAGEVGCILLKGPAIAQWLYPEGARTYEDCDLLIDPGRRPEAERILRELGFRPYEPPPAGRSLTAPVSISWLRDWQRVDLHSSFWGLAAPPSEVWAALDADAVTGTVARSEVRMPSRPARIMLVALHAVHHARAPQPLADLELALEREPADAWAEAYRLARRLGGERAFAAALTLTHAGPARASALGVPRSRAAETALSAAGLPLSEGFERLTQARGLRGRLSVARAELLPTVEFMRWRYPLAGRGAAGLVLSYGLRLLSIATALARVLWAARRRR